MSRKQEEFIFFQECLTRLNSAWAIIEALDTETSHKTVAWAAFRMALIEYAKPYKRSVGAHVKRHVLSFPQLSDQDRALHDEILRLRDTVLAHSDISVKDAKLYLGTIGGRPFPMIISNTLPLLPALSEARGLIERSLDQLYKQLPDWEARLSGQP